MFYGWGNTSQNWTLNDGNTLVYAYSYLSLMFIFKVAYKKRWFVTGENRSQDIEVTRGDLEQRYGTDLPTPGVWSQYGLLIAISALIVVAIVASAF